MTITSAYEGSWRNRQHSLTAIKDGKWDEYKGQIQSLGKVSGDDPTLNYVQLPMNSTVWNDGFDRMTTRHLVKSLAGRQRYCYS